MDIRKIEAAILKHGSQRKAALALGIPRSTIQDLLKRRDELIFVTKTLDAPKTIARPRRGVRRLILTSAQADTAVHEGFMRNLEAYAQHLNASIHVAGFTYNKGLYTEHEKKKVKAVEWHPRVMPYLTWDRFDIGDRLVFCAEMNTLPTAVTPLNGFETYTRGKWGIFPHAKVQLQSVPTMKHEPAKIIMTTGAVTQPNYVMKRAGIRSIFHHVIGAVIVELLPDGEFFCRHLLGDSKTGDFYDLKNHVSNGVVTGDHRLLGINWGDIHIEKHDNHAMDAIFGYDADACVNKQDTSHSMLDVMDPEYSIVHDLHDFEARNHHNIKNPHFIFEQFIKGRENVEDGIRQAASFLNAIQRERCQTLVVESNHDLALERWLKEADYKIDPVNAEFFLEAQLMCYRHVRRAYEGLEPEAFSIFEHMVRSRAGDDKLLRTLFLRTDESFLLGGEIECGLHGHLGANGAKGSPRSFTRMGPKANTGHTHSASIIDGIYTAGVTGSLDMGYNTGLSSWSRSHIFTYRNNKRAIITMSPSGRWCADQ